MSKSRYSKTKETGLLCGMERHMDYKFRMTGSKLTVMAENRQMRRLKEKK